MENLRKSGRAYIEGFLRNKYQNTAQKTGYIERDYARTMLGVRILRQFRRGGLLIRGLRYYIGSSGLLQSDSAAQPQLRFSGFKFTESLHFCKIRMMDIQKIAATLKTLGMVLQFSNRLKVRSV